MADTNFGTFTKDGKTRVAASQRQAVSLRFAGWQEEKPPTPAAVKQLEAATAPATPAQ